MVKQERGQLNRLNAPPEVSTGKPALTSRNPGVLPPREKKNSRPMTLGCITGRAGPKQELKGAAENIRMCATHTFSPAAPAAETFFLLSALAAKQCETFYIRRPSVPSRGSGIALQSCIRAASVFSHHLEETGE